MTKAARQALNDAHRASHNLQRILDGEFDIVEWRLRWTLVVTLLRTVGNVLHNIDKEDRAFTASIAAHWSELEKHKDKYPIFWEFIKRERDNILKEYAIGAGRGVAIHVPRLSVRLHNETQQIVTEQIGERSIEYYDLVTSGEFRGRSQIELVHEALQWWERQLESIEKAAEQTCRGDKSHHQ